MKFFSYDTGELSIMPKREADGNKGAFGRILCVCGSEGMAGAAYLAAKAAYRSGAGLVEVLTHRVNLPIIQTLIPEAVVSVYDEDYQRDTILSCVERADAIVIGCGLSQSVLARNVLSDVLRARGENIPLVIDADALNLLSRNRSLLKYAKGAVITPHVAEMSRLCGRSIEEIKADKEQTAKDFAEKYSLVCVLKDHVSVVSDGGEEVYINKRGNSGMATGGSGDVLAGIIGAILCQASKRSEKIDMLSLASLGVYIHSFAGDLAASEIGEYSVMASDIIESIPKVLKRVHN